MAKYGHHLAFHVIHLKIGEDGSIKPVTGQQDFIVADEDGTIASSREDGMEIKKDVSKTQQSAPKSDPKKMYLMAPDWKLFSRRTTRIGKRPAPCNVAVHSGQVVGVSVKTIEERNYRLVSTKRLSVKTSAREACSCSRDYHDIRNTSKNQII